MNTKHLNYLTSILFGKLRPRIIREPMQLTWDAPTRLLLTIWTSDPGRIPMEHRRFTLASEASTETTLTVSPFLASFNDIVLPAFQLWTTLLNQLKSVRRHRPSWSKTILLNEKGGSFPEQAPYPLLQACPESLPFAATGEASRRIN